MKNIRLIVLGLFFVLMCMGVNAYATVSPGAVWDVRTTGSDTNGGFFVIGQSGTDWSQQNTPQYSTTDGVTAGTTTITSATANFGTDVVGNGIYVAGGTGSITGAWYQIETRASSTTITVDRSTGLSTGTGATLHIGGGLLTIQQGITSAFLNGSGLGDSIVYVKKGTYTGTAALSFSGIGVGNYASRLIGYNSTHGDNPLPSSGNQPMYKVGSGAGVDGVDINGQSGIIIRFMEFNGIATTGSEGVIGINITSGEFNSVWGCKIDNFTTSGFSSNQGGTGISWSEVTLIGSSGTAAVIVPEEGSANFNWIHKNTETGMQVNPLSTANFNLVTNSTGASSDGIQINYGSTVIGNTVYGSGRDGFRTAGNGFDTTINDVWVDNISAKSAGYGLNNVSSSGAPTTNPSIQNNAYYGNTSGNYNNITAGVNDVAVSVNPFNSSDANLASETSPDWGLNNTASAGASLRNAGFPGQLSGDSYSTGYADMGVFRHQDAAASTCTNINNCSIANANIY